MFLNGNQGNLKVAYGSELRKFDAVYNVVKHYRSVCCDKHINDFLNPEIPYISLNRVFHFIFQREYC